MERKELKVAIKKSEEKYESYRTWVQIDKQELDEEILQHADKYKKILEERANAKDRLLAACIRLKSRTFSETALSVYNDVPKGGKAPTKDVVEKSVRADNGYVLAANLADRAQYLASLWESLATAFGDRGARMRLLVDLIGATAGTNYVRIDYDRSEVNRSGVGSERRRRRNKINLDD